MPRISAAGHSLEYLWIGDKTSRNPVLVFLHEGLGSIRHWRDFPARVAEATGLPALIYDRYGYGESEVLQEPRRTTQYIHDEALIALPELLERLEIQRPILIGLSDGASIALIYAGAGNAVRGLIVMAPHVFIEDISIAYIERAVHTFEQTDFAARFGRYHRDPRKTFYGWADIWLDPDFKRWDIRGNFLPEIHAPVLAIQGFDDECGTMAQVDEIHARVKGPCEVLKLHSCGHVVFRDQADEVLPAVTRFIGSVQ